MQHARGFIVVCANGWLWSPGRQSTPNNKLGELYMQHVTYRLQGDWLHVCKAVLLVQTSRATCLQSNPIDINFAGFCLNLSNSIGANGTGFCSNLGVRGLLSSPAGFLLGAYWLAGSRSPNEGGESHHFAETETQVPASCQPHIIKLISQLQKPTRKISDTWIIDTGKRETRYQLVKIHQTIRQPHKATVGWLALGKCEFS